MKRDPGQALVATVGSGRERAGLAGSTDHGEKPTMVTSATPDRTHLSQESGPDSQGGTPPHRRADAVCERPHHNAICAPTQAAGTGRELTIKRSLRDALAALARREVSDEAINGALDSVAGAQGALARELDEPGAESEHEPFADLSVDREQQIANGEPDGTAAVPVWTISGEKIVEFARPLVGEEALHYDEWLRRLRVAGYEVAGKDPRAVVLVNLSRHPLVVQIGEGVYAFDATAIEGLRERVALLRLQVVALIESPILRDDLYRELRRSERLLQRCEAWT